MKVLHIIEKLDLHGGTPTKLLNMLQHSSHEHIFATFFDTSEETQKRFNNSGATIVKVESGAILFQIAFLRRFILENNCPVVNTHFFRPYLIALALKFLAPSFKWIHHEHSAALYLSPVRRLAIFLTNSTPDAITANSEHVRSDVMKNLGYRAGKISVVYPGVSLREKPKKPIGRTSFDIPKNDLLFLHIGGMIPLRDQKTIILAFHKFNQENQNSTLVLVGDGPEKENLRNLALQLGVMNKIKFLSYLENPIDLLRESDIYVNSTLDEGFGIAVVEAQLAGVPVILSLAGAHKETGIEGGAIFYSPGSHASLFRAMKFIEENLSEIRNLMPSVRTVSEDKFSPANFAKQFDSLINSL